MSLTTPEDPRTKHRTKRPEDDGTMTRRSFMKEIGSRVFAVLATGGLAYQIGGKQVLEELLAEQNIPEGDIPEHEAISALNEAEAEAERSLKEALQHVEEQYPTLTEKEKAMKAIDYLGCAVFAYGVGSLIKGGHIAALHYGMFSAVMAAKYSLSNEEERHHLMEEFRTSAKAGMIIGGTVALAEGIKGDLDKAYTKIAQKDLTNTDRTALLTMLSGVVSPLVTTVGSATLSKKMAIELAGGDMDKAAVLMQYVSNSSGFLLFGDPPFIAVCEKYGFTEGVMWQAETMWPMALYSLFSSAYKINLLRAKEEGVSEGAPSWALKETLRGFKRNLPVLKKIIQASLGNVAKFYTGASLSSKVQQKDEGLQFNIDEVLEQKFNGVVALFKGEIDSSSHHEDQEGLQGDSERERVIKELLEEHFSPLTEGKEKNDIEELHTAINDLDFEKILELTKNLGIDPTRVTPMLVTAEKLLKKHTPKDEEEKQYPWQVRAWDYVDYLTDLNNVKGSIGHNLGDIVDVFPFQAGCVPFLATGFKDTQGIISKLLEKEELQALMPTGLSKERAMEAIMYFLIMGFSSIADNYVACKIGLELFPEKPEVALVPSIIGGGMSSVGNMANLALFNLEQMPLATSFAKDYWHLDIAAFGLLWSQVLRDIQGKPPLDWLFGEGIKPKKTAKTH